MCVCARAVCARAQLIDSRDTKSARSLRSLPGERSLAPLAPRPRPFAHIQKRPSLFPSQASPPDPDRSLKDAGGCALAVAVLAAFVRLPDVAAHPAVAGLTPALVKVRWREGEDGEERVCFFFTQPTHSKQSRGLCAPRAHPHVVAHAHTRTDQPSRMLCESGSAPPRGLLFLQGAGRAILFTRRPPHATGGSDI